MLSPDGPGADPERLAQKVAGDHVHSQLVEALILVLVEKGVLAKNDALSIVQSVAEVRIGSAEEGVDEADAAVEMLKRLYFSFDALPGGFSAAVAESETVRHLRPPVYGGRPAFPGEETD